MADANPASSTAKPGKPRKLLLVCLLALVAVTIGGLVLVSLDPFGVNSDEFRVSGAPLPINFVGVQLDGTDEVFDAEGTLVERMKFADDWRAQDLLGRKCKFIFDLSACKAEAILSGGPQSWLHPIPDGFQPIHSGELRAQTLTGS